MAKYVVPPKDGIIIQCERCKTLYVPDVITDSVFFEKCPICNCPSNSMTDTIPLWKYNLIKLFREGFKSFK